MSTLLLLIGALLGVPLFIVIATAACYWFGRIELDSSIVIIEISRLADTPMLLALPLFIFAGTLLSQGKAADRLLNLSRAVLGWLPGGLGIVGLLVAALFTAFTGASGVTIIALGGLLLPALINDGYDHRFALGLVTSSGSLGLLFPPSLPLILYGVIAEVRIDHLFRAGIFPGLLMLLVLCGYAGYKAPRRRRQQNRAPEVGRALRGAAWDLPLPVLILGGIYGGVMVVGEAAAVTCLYVLFTEGIIHRDIPWRTLPRIVLRSMVLFGGIFMVLALSLALTSLLIDQQIPGKLFTFIARYISSKYSFLLLLNLFLLLVGAMLDIFSALVLIVPLIVPVAVSYGIDLTHLGIIFLANMQIGYCTPPVGLNLFLAGYRFNKPIFELYRAALPFLLLLLAVLGLITYLPQLSLWLL